MGGCLSIGNRIRSGGGESSSPWARSGSQRARQTKGSVSEQVITLQQLPSIPSRIVVNGRSKTSCIFTQQGRKGINQDAMIIWEDFVSADAIFCGVFDGHGPHGHLVARRVRDALPLKLMSFLQSHEMGGNGRSGNCFKAKIDMDDSMSSVKESSQEDPLISLWRDSFLKSFKAMDKELRSHPSVDCFCSGSTAVTLVKQGSNLFIGNIGDSRAVLGSKCGMDSVVAIQLTVDLKPDLPREAERIKRCKGRVFALQDEPEVQRVWLPFDDAPGLAMARAFGDFCLKDYGLISIPEFSHRLLTEKDQFIVLASDGVWDVLSNDDVVEIVSAAPIRSSAARVVVDSAVREWKVKYPTSKMDDCAVVCLYLDGKMDCESETEEPSVSAACYSLVNESDDGQNLEPCLQRNFTVRTTEGGDLKARMPIAVEGSGTLAVAEDQNWLGLEGVTRVNSLVQLPRFSEERANA